MTVNDPFQWDKRCLALDLATATGWAYSGNEFRAGTKILATPAEIKTAGKRRLDRRNDFRIERLFTFLQAWRGTVEIVVFEDVEFSSYTKQTQLWASLRAAMWLALPYAHFEAVPVGTLKKFAGHGSATKTMMANFLARQYPDRFELTKKGQLLDRIGPCGVLDDNAVDAIWLWLWAKHNLGRI